MEKSLEEQGGVIENNSGNCLLTIEYKIGIATASLCCYKYI